MKPKLVTTLAVALTIVLLSSFVSALTIKQVDDADDLYVPGDNFIGRLISKLTQQSYIIGTFTVYGDELECDEYPSGSSPVIFKNGDAIKVTAGAGESSFVNWFRGSPYDNQYASHLNDDRQFLREDFITDGSSISWECDAGAYWDSDGDGKGECYVEWYDCDKNPCYSDSDCSSGETCVKDILSQKIPNAGVCKITNPTHLTNVYECYNGQKDLVGSVSWGDTNFCNDPSDSKYLIGSTDSCLSFIPSECTTCDPQWSCNNWDVCQSNGIQTRTCTDSNNCGTTSGRPAISQACSIACILDCTGKCGGVSDGCTGTCDAVCPTTPTCSDGFQNQDETGIDCGGPCSACVTPPSETCPDGTCSITEQLLGSCMQDCEKDIAGVFQVYDLTYGDPVGGKIEGNLKPGQAIKVSFKVRSETQLTKPYLVEVGIIPYSTAVLWDMDKPEGFFSLFAIGEDQKDACCVGQSNVADNIHSLSTTIWSEAKVRDFSFDLRVPNSDIKDLCGNEIYWDNSSNKYVLYAIVKNGCYKDGYRKNVFIAQTILLNYNETESTEGIGCAFDYECAEGEQCLDAPGFFTGKTCQYTGVDAKGNSFIDVKKIALTRDEISKSTSADLLASACLSNNNNECVTDTEDYVSCISIASLREDGVLSEDDSENFFTNAKTLTKGTVIGVTAGTIFCIVSAKTVVGFVSLGVGALLASPAILGGCAAVGGVLGLTLTGAVMEISDQDNLVKELGAKNENAVGICTLEKTFDFGGFIKKLGNSIKITGNAQTDGYIILIGGLFILFFFLNLVGGRK